jgi:hypothetical protein
MKRSLALLVVSLPVPLVVYACGGDNSVIPPGTDAASDAPASEGGGDDGPTVDGVASDAPGDSADAGPIVCPGRNPLKNPYFGDLHAHTSYSFDAYSFDTRNTPYDAYAFAKGQTVQVAGAQADGGGPTTTIDRPLDFLAITDHSEWLALTYGCGALLDGGPQDPQQAPYYGSPQCVFFRSTDPANQDAVFAGAAKIQNTVCEAGTCPPVVQSAWQSEQAAAAAAYEPCKFTSFVAYEWTHAVAGATLHKNVIFATNVVPAAPIDSFDFPTQPQLWNALDQQCVEDAGCRAITIPHNSNLSQGGAFDVPAGSESQMVKYQRLVEIFQHKGGSECFFDPNNPTDPACNFEYLGGITELNLPQSYVRTALENGIATYAQTKTNPLQMGIIGATDDHNGAPGNSREDTWPGHAGRLDDTPDLRIKPAADGGPNGVSLGHNPGGVAVAWAEQNTRASIFAAFERRETYATSGPRMVVRFYQTWDSSSDPCADPNFPSALVAAGAVPMGGTFALPSGDAGTGEAGSGDAAGAAPRLVVYAWKDTVDLARLDIVKAWVDGQGQIQEQVITHDVTGSAPACYVWTDPAFTPSPTFYYARVLQTPTPRWSTYDCAASPASNPVGCADGGYLNITIQERAWTSPIWYLP